MDLEALNKIAKEAGDLDARRESYVAARKLVESIATDRESLVAQIKNRNCALNNYERSPSDSHKLVYALLDQVIGSLSKDILAVINSHLQAHEMDLFVRAAAKRLSVTASIVSKPADTDGGAS